MFQIFVAASSTLRLIALLHRDADILYKIIHVTVSGPLRFLGEKAARYASFRAMEQNTGAAFAPFIAISESAFTAIYTA